MRMIHRGLSAIAVGASLVSPAAAAQDDCSEPVARYDVSYAGGDQFEVVGHFVEPQTRWDLAHWTPPGRPMGHLC